MKILQTKDIAPIYLAPGDEIQLTYREPYFGFLGKVK